MRAVLSMAVVLLALTLALNRSRALLVSSRPPPVLADRALEIIAGAKGPMLPAAHVGSGPETIGEAIRLGDRTFVATRRDGLRALFLGADFTVRSERCYDVGHSAEDARALRAAAEEAEEGTVLVLASSGRIEPEGGGAARDELERTLALLGARAQPGTATPESWAMLVLRLERGWVPLAESYSRDSGVALAFVLAPELESYADFAGDLALVRAGRIEIDLESELAYASRRTAGIEPVRDATVQGQHMSGILLPPDVQGGTAGQGRLAWSGIEIGTGSWFVAWLGLQDGTSTGSDGVTFELRVDGEVAERRPVQPGARWRVLSVPLKAFAGRKVDIELAVDARASAAGDSLLVGWPRLFHGYERSPLQVWAEERDER